MGLPASWYTRDLLIIWDDTQGTCHTYEMINKGHVKHAHTHTHTRDMSHIWDDTQGTCQTHTHTHTHTHGTCHTYEMIHKGHAKHTHTHTHKGHATHRRWVMKEAYPLCVPCVYVCACVWIYVTYKHMWHINTNETSHEASIHAFVAVCFQIVTSPHILIHVRHVAHLRGVLLAPYNYRPLLQKSPIKETIFCKTQI